MLISGPRDGRGYVHSMEQTSVKRQFGLVTRLSCMCVRGRGVAQRGWSGGRGDGVG